MNTGLFIENLFLMGLMIGCIVAVLTFILWMILIAINSPQIYQTRLVMGAIVITVVLRLIMSIYNAQIPLMSIREANETGSFLYQIGAGDKPYDKVVYIGETKKDYETVYYAGYHEGETDYNLIVCFVNTQGMPSDCQVHTYSGSLLANK